MRLRLCLLVLAAFALAAAGLPSAPSLAQSSGPRRVVPVFPGIERQEWEFKSPSGAPVASQVLVVANDPSLRVRPVLAQGQVPGLETVQSMGRRMLPEGGVAGINGGFWLFQPVGDPNSYMAIGGDLVSDAETQGRTGRGTLGFTAEGEPLIDKLETAIELFAATGEITVEGVNRTDRGGPFPDSDDAIYIFNHFYGEHVTLPGPEAGENYRGAATVLSIPSMRMPASGTGNDGVVPVADVVAGGRLAIPPDGLLIVGYGDGAQQLAELVPGERLYASVRIDTLDRERDLEWRRVFEGIAAGPLIISEGRITPEESWDGEGFAPGHLLCCGPRSAIGIMADGRTLMVTVDGRDSEHSVGMSMLQLAEYLIELGAVDAISLDGGGSTTMVVDGIVRNQPSDGQARSVASGLFVFHDHEFTVTERLSGSGREATAAAVALAAHADGAQEVLLANGGNFPDALAGGPLASALGAPLLLSSRDAISADTETALRQLGARRITLLGGTGVVSTELADELRDAGYEVRRLSGASRFDTAAAIAAALGGDRQRIVLASGEGFPDALSVAAPAGMLGAPIVLTGNDALPEATGEAIVRSGAKEVVIVGGSGVVSPRVEQTVRELAGSPAVTRLGGTTRFGTARVINTWAAGQIADLDQTGLIVADGGKFPDALAGGPLAAARRQLLMIVPGPDVTAQQDAAAYLDERANGGLARVTLLGGHGVLSSFQEWQLEQFALR